MLCAKIHYFIKKICNFVYVVHPNSIQLDFVLCNMLKEYQRSYCKEKFSSI